MVRYDTVHGDRSIVWKDRDRMVLTASSEGQVYIWEAATGKRLPDTYQVRLSACIITCADIS